MMIVLAPQAIDMQRQTRLLRKALQPVRQHLAAQIAELLARQAEVYDAEGPRGEVDDGAGQGFVERGVGGAEADKAERGEGRGREGEVQAAAEGEEGVFGGVVVVDWVGGVGVSGGAGGLWGGWRW